MIQLVALQLFDIEADPTEKHDMSEELPEKVCGLFRLLERWSIVLNDVQVAELRQRIKEHSAKAIPQPFLRLEAE